MVALSRSAFPHEGVTVGLPPGLVAPPGLSVVPELSLERALQHVDEDPVFAQKTRHLSPMRVPEFEQGCLQDQHPHAVDHNLSAENTRLALENERLRLQYLQKEMVGAMYGKAVYDMNMRTAAARAFPNPWYPPSLPLMDGVPHPQHALRTRTDSDLPAAMFPGFEPSPRHGLRTGDMPAMVSTAPARARADTDGAVLTKPPVSAPCTTLMLRNLPNNYTRAMMLALLDAEGFAGQYDFVYLPIDFKSHASLGYAFCNMTSVEQAERCWKAFEGFNRWVVPSQKVCSVNWSAPFQGLEAHVERYRNSPVMHEHVPDEYKPMLFVKGTRVAFPPPTKKIRAPRIRPGRNEQSESGSCSD